MRTISGTAAGGSLEQFVTLYEPGMASSWVSVTGQTLLIRALANSNSRDRSEIVNFLLDEGADATVVMSDGYNVLHVLFGKASFDGPEFSPENVDLDASLLRRLLDSGADINAVSKKQGTPLQYLCRTTSRLRDEAVANPYYEIMFSREGLDLLKVGDGKSTYETIWGAFGGKLMLQYAQHYLRRNGIEVPDLLPSSPSL